MIRKRSKKRAKEEARYSIRVGFWKKENPLCKAGVTGCTKYTEDCHHKKGRAGIWLLDESFWIPVCRHCHIWIEMHPIQAKEKGWSISRLAV